MEDPFKKWKKKVQKSFFSETEVSPDSDFPVHERYTKEKNVQTMGIKKKNNKRNK